MLCCIEVLLTPAEFQALAGRDLSQSVCVVFDVLRASSTFVTALANGAAAIIPVAEITEALAVRARQPDVLLAGERNGLRIGGELSGGVEFDLGNSPQEFTPAQVKDRTVVSTTTNGTRALRACAGARRVLVGSFLNLDAAVRAVLAEQPDHLLLVCAGTGEGVALEDVLAAGAFCERFRAVSQNVDLDWRDSAEVARESYRAVKHDLVAAASRSQNARRLRRLPELSQDVEYCLRLDQFNVVPGLDRTGQRLTTG